MQRKIIKDNEIKGNEIEAGLEENRQSVLVKGDKKQPVEVRLEEKREEVKKLASRERLHFVSSETLLASGMIHIPYNVYTYGGEILVEKRQEDNPEMKMLGGNIDCEIVDSPGQFAIGEKRRINSDQCYKTKEEAEEFVQKENFLDVYEVIVHNQHPICKIDTSEPIHIATIVKACSGYENFSFSVNVKKNISKTDFYSQSFINSNLRNGDSISGDKDFEIAALIQRQKMAIMENLSLEAEKILVNMSQEDEERIQRETKENEKRFLSEMRED